MHLTSEMRTISRDSLQVALISLTLNINSTRFQHTGVVVVIYFCHAPQEYICSIVTLFWIHAG